LGQVGETFVAHVRCKYLIDSMNHWPNQRKGLKATSCGI